MHILGISGFYHDSAACLIKDGKIIAAAEEERFVRKKHYNGFPFKAIEYCLKEGEITIDQVDYVGFYEKPFLKFERILQTFIETFPFSFPFFYNAIPSWLNEKLRIKSIIKNKVGFKKDILFVDHHTSHAASAFFVSGFKQAAILTVDGIGEWKSTGLYVGKDSTIAPLKEINFPDSLGLFYSTITTYLGFKVNNDEYKVMGLAAYGKPRYYNKFLKMIDIKPDGSFKLDMKYFSYRGKQKMWSKELEKLLGTPREHNGKIEKRHQDIASTLQKITEEVMINMANHLHSITKLDNLCIAGGVGLNSVANGKLRKETPFKKIFIQPAATDAGGALGVAYYIHHQILGNKRNYDMKHVYHGPEFNDNYVKKFLDANNIKYEKLSEAGLVKKTAKLIAENKIVAWFQGRMEWGPRALGNRSILVNPMKAEMKDILNKRVKHREPFRPFAASFLAEKAKDYLDIDYDSPFMIVVFDVKGDKRKTIPAVTHVDGTCRVQTVRPEENKLYYGLIREFGRITKVPAVLNTSFNVRGQPIVCTPEEAYQTFCNTHIDYLVLNKFLIGKDFN